jgi:ParB-like chromosome segregation protein Spo0J
MKRQGQGQAQEHEQKEHTIITADADAAVDTDVNIKKIKIEDIKVANRFRKDLGDIDTLAQSIKDAGLLQPICVNEDTNELVDGGRRIEAYKRLGMSEIPVYLIPIKDILQGQLYANVVRKDFTVEEQVKITEAIASKRIGHRTKKGANLEPFQLSHKGKKTVEIASEYIGTSPAQLSKIKDVYFAAQQYPEEFGYLIKEIDDKKITVNEAKTKIEKYFQSKIELEQEAKDKKRREEQRQKSSIERLQQQKPIRSSSQSSQPQPQQQQQIDKLEDFDPTKRDSYDRQTLYKVIDWLFEEVRNSRQSRNKNDGGVV